MENWPGRFSVFLLLASRLYVSQQGEAKWPCGAVFPISALPIETRPVFCCQRAALTPSECFVVAFTFDIDHSHESKPCFFMQRGIMKTGGRERAGISSGGVSLEECSWWSAGESDECVSELRVPRGVGRIRPAVALGSLCLSLSLIANLFWERKRRTDAPSKMLYFPFLLVY